MIRPKSSALRLEALEDRSVPAIFGQPWLDGRHLTLSFAPDGTAVSGTGSNLTGLSGVFGGVSAAELEILRAFQTWAVNANLNVGVVGDSGAPFGTAGAIQNDPRFGDIRIGARALAGDVVAITAPFSLLTPNSGDLIFNAAKAFAAGNAAGAYDLFTVAMQEAGHAFGMSNSVDPASVMFEQYQSARAGLSAGDVTGIQGLYGARTPDAYEGSTGNGTLATATPFAAGLEADLTTAQDVDTYRYVATSAAGRWFRVKAAGLSLVNAKLEVLDATGQVIGSAQATNPLQNDVTVYVPQLTVGAAYYLRVSSARSDVFGIGAYRLAADNTQAGPGAGDPNALVDTETNANNTVATAATPARSTGPYDYSFRSSLSTASDVDFYRIHAPTTASGLTRLNVTVAAVGQSGYLPQVDIYTAAGVLLTTTQVVAQTDSSVVVSADEVPAGVDYLVRVSNTLWQSGNYDFVADFQAVMPKMMGARGTLTSALPSTAATMNIWQSQVVQINLLANLTNGSDFVGEVRLYNADNQVVFDLLSLTGLLSTGQVYLPRGAYTVEIRALTAATINFNLSMFGVTDPEGTSPTDPTGAPTGGGGAPLPPPPDPTTTVGITPTTTTTTSNPNTGQSTTVTTTTDAATGTVQKVTTTVSAAGVTTTAIATLATDIVWF
jgi:Matrixin